MVSVRRMATFLSLILSSSVIVDSTQSPSEHSPSSATPSAVCKTTLTGPIETTECNFEALDSVGSELFQQLHELVETPFFRYFRVDLYRECPFWQENGVCMNRECGITTVDENDIPERWRASALSKVEVPSEVEINNLPGCYYRDSDFCFLDSSTEGEYIDLVENPERFTGYAAPASHRVWNAIYQENCFGQSEATWSSSKPVVSVPDTLLLKPGPEDTCVEKRVFYKVISGLHTSISTHICMEFFNQTTGTWAPNLQCFIDRAGAHPDRLQQMYFNTVLLLRAVSRLGPYLSAYDYCSTGTHEEDVQTKSLLGNIINIAHQVGKFDEKLMFARGDSNVLKQQFKDHFRNVTRIMDCVGCDKCRLWGKVQTTGVATAMKILFELDEKALDPNSNKNLLTRSEVVALMNTLHRFAESLHAVNLFRGMWAAEREPNSLNDIEFMKSSPLMESLRTRSSAFYEYCKAGAKDCAANIASLRKSFASVFSRSRRNTDNPLHIEL
ncbi:endoplasmic reticulum Oxidoreductin 1-domain-containing protein [Thelephora terrestris]|uniref:Endoplasmic reticulum Oxidoreductin 1-domain-containing protein n=1 Tax=Thelephora terrestris TaxID=56493 RepID=A0A9P6HQB6_9AGAM|nr:endoplasmic reticulum Oxidoreductin 1-domain-containing protein [Thelephora terrestris]